MYNSSYMKYPKQASRVTESRLMVARGQGEGRIESDYSNDTGFPLRVIKTF